MLSCGVLYRGYNVKVKRGIILGKKFELSPLKVWIVLWIVNFKLISSVITDITKGQSLSKFVHDDDNNDDTTA